MSSFYLGKDVPGRGCFTGVCNYSRGSYSDALHLFPEISEKGSRFGWDRNPGSLLASDPLELRAPTSVLFYGGPCEPSF
jgi:hypothetical protein